MTASRSVRAGSLAVRSFPTAQAMATAAAQHTADALRRSVTGRGAARMVVATGNSQLAFVTALASIPLPWDLITVFHMDEYVGIGADHPASFRRWIRERVAEPMRPARVEYIDGSAADVAAECVRYEAILREAPIDTTCMGIGENGHLAFNEPGDADLDDARWVRQVTLTRQSRRQQVGEGHFPALDAVPSTAISLTVPALLSARTVQVVVPERRKARAVRATLTLDVSARWPSTVLRETPHATLFLDADSASESADVLDELKRR